MNMIDYTGKLNNHKDYLKILEKIEKRCQYIEFVLVHHNTFNELVSKYQKDIISYQEVSEWWGTISSDKIKSKYYKLKASKEIFNDLKKYETFCKYIVYDNYQQDKIIYTAFGTDDIAFLDDNNNYLLYTTTHEGYISICDSLI